MKSARTPPGYCDFFFSRWRPQPSWIFERFELGVGARKKDSTGPGKKSQKGYISPICGEVPTKAMYIKICVVGDVLDVIMCAKFQNKIFRGYNFTGGLIFHFSY